ncbi:MAG: LamG domain-containing protein [Planctomycetaceae bacterium]|nr:LamG domain-containing protein [Planctomycetaceae bacterium]
MAAAASGPATAAGISPLAAEAQKLDDAARVERAKKASGEFERIFGKHVRAVLATPAVQDDLALAEKLMAMQPQAADDVFFAAAMCEKAYDLSAPSAAGQTTAAAALEQLLALAPWKSRAWLESLVEIRRKSFAAARGEDRTAEGDALIAATLRLAEALADDDAFNEAYEVCHRLLPLAKAVKSKKADDIEAAQDRYAALKPIGQAMAVLQIRIKANPADQLARNELMRLYVAERNAPRKAAAYLTAKAPADYQANIPDAQRSLAALDAADCLRLGLWYEDLIDRASEQGKALAARRSRDYLQQYLDLHETADATRAKAAAAIKKLDALLASLAGKKTHQAMKFVRTLDVSAGRLVSNLPMHFRNPYAQRTIDLWMLAGKDDGIIVDQGASRAGMVVGLFKNRICFAFNDAKEHTHIVQDDKGNNRTEPIPAAVISAPLPDRDKWCHVAVQYANGYLSLWINGKLSAERQVGTPAIPGDTEGVCIGGGFGSNAGYWDAKGFGGKVAAVRFSSRARYSKNFEPEEQMGTTGAFAFVCADRLSTGELDRSTRDSVSASYIVWSSIGQVRVVNVD